MDRTVPAGAARLLDFIYRRDAGSPPPACYETIFGNRQNRLSKPITKMTLGDLIDAQKNWSSKAWVKANWGYGTASSASGAAQFMRDTLIGLAKELSLNGNPNSDHCMEGGLQPTKTALIAGGYYAHRICHENGDGKARRMTAQINLRILQ